MSSSSLSKLSWEELWKLRRRHFTSILMNLCCLCEHTSWTARKCIHCLRVKLLGDSEGNDIYRKNRVDAQQHSKCGWVDQVFRTGHMTAEMDSWKNHVRARLLQRDETEKLPHVGVFTTLSQLEERFEIRQQILDDVQSNSSERDGVEAGKNTTVLYLQLRETEHLSEKLSQTVSDLTAILHLKEAELQYWQSRVSQYRQEALNLAKGNNTVKATLSELEFTLECQSKELAALRAEQKGLKESLIQAVREKEELLQRWIEEKREEADRVNKYNDAQERWHRLSKRLKKHLQQQEREKSLLIDTPH